MGFKIDSYQNDSINIAINYEEIFLTFKKI